jgi:magnesium-transporting ATPase (P-type)
LWSSDWALANGNIAYPLLATDDQMRTMKNKSYNNETPLSLEQLLDIYMESPVETLMLIAKKLVIGFDQKTNIAHPGDGAVPWRETVGMIFSLWNYFVLFSGMYAFCKNKEIVAKEKWMAGLVFVLTVLPQTFMKIEWRYVMIGYFLIYYFFAFYFVGPLLQERKKRRTLLMQTDYLMKLSIFMFVCLTLSFLFLA